MAGSRLLIERTAATASLVALQPGISDLSRQAIELDRVHHVVKKSSFLTVESTQKSTTKLSYV